MGLIMAVYTKTKIALGAAAGMAAVAATPVVLGVATGVTATGPIAGGAFATAQAAGDTASALQSVVMGGVGIGTKVAAGAAGAAAAKRLIGKL